MRDRVHGHFFGNTVQSPTPCPSNLLEWVGLERVGYVTLRDTEQKKAISMHLAIGNDHRGVNTKHSLVAHLQAAGHQVEDYGAADQSRVDYPDIAADVCRRVIAGQVDRGILICGSGIGMCIAANKVSGVRAVVSLDLRAAEASRRHNDANVLCLSGDWVDNEQNASIVDLWLSTAFEGGRHATRVEKITGIEQFESE